MKKFLWLFLVCNYFFFSCSDGDDGGNGFPNDDDDYEEYPYSHLTPEQQKEKLAKEAETLFNALEGLTQNQGALLLARFSTLLPYL